MKNKTRIEVPEFSKVRKDLISVTEYARRHKITRQAVHKRIHSGKLKALKVGKYFAIKI